MSPRNCWTLRWCFIGWNFSSIPARRKGVVERLGAQVGVPAIEHVVVDLVSAPLGGQERRNERLRLVPGGGDGER